MEFAPSTVARMGSLSLVIAVSAAVGYQLAEPGRLDTERLLDSSVSIKTISHVTTDRFGDSVWDSAFGSGFLVSSEPCEVWTNHHVVADAAVIRVIPRGADPGEGIPAHVVHATPRPDVAVLRLNDCTGIRVARLGESARLKAGTEVYAVGNPLGRHPDSISRGIISHAERHVGANTYLQTDASINPGNSGGALFDRKGRVIGMNVSLVSIKKSGANSGIGYALPIDRVKTTVKKLHARTPGWGTGGIADIASDLNSAEAAVFNVPGNLPAIILTATPAEGPGTELLRERDVIYRVDGVEAIDAERVRRLFAEHAPGTVVPLKLVRDGRRLTVNLTLGDGYRGVASPAAQPYEGLLGMTLEMWNQRDGEEGRFQNPIITQVQGLGPAHLAEISSSQHSVGFSGTKLVEFVLDVKTVTGAVLDGNYHPTPNIASLNDLAAAAHARSAPLLLEIEHWARKDPRNARTELVHRDTAFFKVDPKPGVGGTEPKAISAELAPDSDSAEGSV